MTNEHFFLLKTLLAFHWLGTLNAKQNLNSNDQELVQ